MIKLINKQYDMVDEGYGGEQHPYPKTDISRLYDKISKVAASGIEVPEEVKEIIEDMYEALSRRSNRFMEAEDKIMEVSEMNFMDFMLRGQKTLKDHIKDALEKYDF